MAKHYIDERTEHTYSSNPLDVARPEPASETVIGKSIHCMSSNKTRDLVVSSFKTSQSVIDEPTTTARGFSQNQQRPTCAEATVSPPNEEVLAIRKPERTKIDKSGRTVLRNVIDALASTQPAFRQHSPHDSVVSITVRSKTDHESMSGVMPQLPSRSYTSEPYRSVVTNFTPLTGSTFDEEFTLKGFSSSWDPSGRCYEDAADSIGLDALTAAHPLPEPKGSQWWRTWRYKWCSTYRKLWSFVIVANMVTIAIMISRISKQPASFTYGSAATATAANLVVATLMRHEHVVNLLFRVACALPQRTPLFIRKRAAKVYSYGGVHSGCGISAALWYIFYTVLAINQVKGSYASRMALAAIAAAILVLFAILITTSHPYIRRRWHNQWELSHRYGGYTAIALVWTQILLTVVVQAQRSASHSIGKTLIATPTFWFLLVITACILYPYIRMRHRPVTTEKLSNHAIRLHFHDRNLPSCVGYRLAHKPLVENHGFATIPNPDGQPGYSIVVSNAGDWTKSLIQNPSAKIWTRGAPTTGVLRIATLFQPIVVVATGSGIGPCLSFLQVHPNHPMRIIWSARSPAQTYGPGVMKAVRRADSRAIVIDTKKTGHPDLPALTYAVYAGTRAEAVVVISNPVVTEKVVFEMESRGIPAFGPIFDS